MLSSNCWTAIAALALPHVVRAAPFSTSDTTPSPAALVTAQAYNALPSATNHLLIDWKMNATSTVSAGPSTTDSQLAPLYFDPDSLTATVTFPVVPTSTAWSLPSFFSNMLPFSVSAYAAGTTSLAILKGSPKTNTAPSQGTDQSFTSLSDSWDDSVNSLQIRYPKGSVNPGNSPQCGSASTPGSSISPKRPTLRSSTACTFPPTLISSRAANCLDSSAGTRGVPEGMRQSSESHAIEVSIAHRCSCFSR